MADKVRRCSPVDGRSLKLLPVASPMSERYCAMLLLPQTLDAPIATGARFVFGRSTPVLAALRVLDAARFLHGDVGHETASADRIGLSRNAFSVEAGADGVRIGRQAASQALFHLDQQLRLVASIEDAEQTYLLPPGHHLVAGHDILRFDA